ncbi:Protein FAM71E2 [Heterocephalus glaber]|uniref:Protein FAM71E2 n=1 Tax=Heterocephalus glaber TaxID=10181 RepID=G5BVZ5_HETGA|nr:Protein FAM71E2 [Heterocephalus glaber]
MGVAASLPGLVLPDILLFAHPWARDGPCLELTRMIPLDFVPLYIHDTSARCLKLWLVTARCYYLDLEAPDHEMGFLLDCWVRLAHLLQELATAWASWPLHRSGHDAPLADVPPSTWRLQDLAHGSQTATTEEPTFPRKSPTVQKPRKAKRRFKSRAVGDSVPLIWPQQECADLRTKSTEKSANPDRRDIQIHGSGKASITIRTIFSIISSTIHQASYPTGLGLAGV